MHTETIELEGCRLSIDGEDVVKVGIEAVCEYETTGRGVAEYQGVTKLIIALGGKSIEICTSSLPKDEFDSIDEAVKPLFESWADDAADVSAADYT